MTAMLLLSMTKMMMKLNKLFHKEEEREREREKEVIRFAAGSASIIFRWGGVCGRQSQPNVINTMGP